MSDWLTRIAIVSSNRFCQFQDLGLVGTNSIGKSTALKVLAGKLKPNLGRFNNPPDWQEILMYIRVSELQNYFTRILEDNLKAKLKESEAAAIYKGICGWPDADKPEEC